MKEKNQNAVNLGRLGGLAKTEKKAKASRENGKKGGRPRKETPADKYVRNRLKDIMGKNPLIAEQIMEKELKP